MKIYISACAASLILLTSCASIWGVRRDRVNIKLAGGDSGSFAYILSNDEYEKEILPISVQSSERILGYLSEKKSGIPTNGNSFTHSLGNFIVIYSCGKVVRRANIQVTNTTETHILDCGYSQ